MKKCTICKQERSDSCFNKKRRSKDGLQNVCRECNAEKSKKYYKNKSEYHKAITRNRRIEKRKELKEKIDKIKLKYGCSKCEENDVVCIEFHHINPENKEFDIASTLRYEWCWTKIASEINKCVCLCANCHRKVHAGRLEITDNMLCQE